MLANLPNNHVMLTCAIMLLVIGLPFCLISSFDWSIYKGTPWFWGGATAKYNDLRCCELT